MEVAKLSAVDWSAPWLAPVADLGRALTSADWRGLLNLFAQEFGITNHAGLQIAFVDPGAVGAESYEAFIARTGQVPTRRNLHDVFNALMWLRLPRTKAQMNRLQAEAIARDGVRATRGTLRDVLTLIDENGVLLVTRRIDVVNALREHDWMSLFDRNRAAWTSDVAVIPLGHALLEKLVSPYKAITAHALHLPLDAGSRLEEIDRYLSEMLGDNLSSRNLMPLPILGIPGWWPRNEDATFYSDATIFRPAKMRSATMRRAS